MFYSLFQLCNAHRSSHIPDMSESLWSAGQEREPVSCCLVAKGGMTKLKFIPKFVNESFFRKIGSDLMKNVEPLTPDHFFSASAELKAQGLPPWCHLDLDDPTDRRARETSEPCQSKIKSVI